MRQALTLTKDGPWLKNAAPDHPEEAPRDRGHGHKKSSGSRLLTLYYQDMKAYPLLNKREEIELSRIIMQGQKNIRRILETGGIDPQAYEEVVTKFRSGRPDASEKRRIVEKYLSLPYSKFLILKKRLIPHEEKVEKATKKLVLSNLRLVVTVAGRFRNRGLHILDLIQEGNMGLLIAAERFDYSKGFRFSTYAVWWIRQRIINAIMNQSRTIRLPAHVIENLTKIQRSARKIIQIRGRAPSVEEIARDSELPVSKIRKILALSFEPVSIDSPLNDRETKMLTYYLKDNQNPLPSEILERDSIRSCTRRVIKKVLNRVEANVLRMKFGLNEGQIEYKVDGISKKIGLGAQRIRQIERKAMAKLRHPCRNKTLKHLLLRRIG